MDSGQPKSDQPGDKPAEGAPAPAADKPAEGGAPASQTTPADALEKTNEELGENMIDATSAVDKGKPGAGGKPAKKVNPIKKTFKKVDVYLLSFVMIMVLVGVVAAVNFLNSQKTPKQAEVATQKLTESALKALASSDATIGNAAQTLTVQGNAIFSGQVLVRNDLDVAGNIQLGGALSAPSLTVSGKTSLGDTQVSTLQVATSSVLQGQTTIQSLNVSGASTFNGPMTASQITVTKLIISGNGQLQVPNHIAFTGGPPSRSQINQSVLGNGGSTSVSGSDATGTINISTGNNPTSGCFIGITFSQPYASQPHVLISPIGIGAAEFEYYVTRTTTGFSVCSANTPPNNQAFQFDYFITD